ncbi:MAG TPA: hypothetical protein PKD90_18220, partial [Phnomibacter sp.]|nr:hypothetical protein [Phnomibacter sp.]
DVSQAGLTYDKNLLTSLVRYRINPGFSNPWLLYSRYIQPQWFLLIAGSYVLSYFFRKQAVAPLALIRFLWLFGGFILAAPLVFYGLEQLAHALGYTYINYSFELSRTGKYIIIPAFLLYAIGIQGLLHTYLPAASQQKWPALAVPVFIAVCWLAMGPLRQWPVLKADFFRAQLPEAVTGYTYLPYQYAHLDSALAFIKANTPEDATFLGEPQIRGGSLRSVPYDHKGASVLLTYEKPKYIEWALKRKVEISIKDPQEKVNFFRSLGTDYMLTDYLYSNTDSLVYQNQQYRLYKMIRREPQQP